MALDAIVSPMPCNTCIRLDVRKDVDAITRKDVDATTKKDVDAITVVIQLNVYKIGQPAKVFQVVMAGRYGRTYTRRRRARDVRRAEERATHTAGAREEEVTTSG
jgi:ABC-type Mn2+/Zn2+ transport system ATPase subunit